MQHTHSPKRKTIEETRLILVERFPKAFMRKGARKRPLKIGIHFDVFEQCPDLARRRIRDAIRDYRIGATYIEQLLEGTDRIDLDGNAVDTVTASHAAHAAAEMAKRAEKRALRKSVSPASVEMSAAA